MRITCVGSLAWDIVVRTPRLPRPGETLAGHGMSLHRGGKGQNQAVAAARLGARVAMVGAVGLDDDGDRLLRALETDGVDTTNVVRLGPPTATHIPILTDDGEVSILIVAGADGALSSSYVERAAPDIATADAVLISCEIGAEAATAAARLARGKVVLNAAPVNETARAVLQHAWAVIGNEHEMAALGDVRADVVITTLGARGATVNGTHVPPFRVDAVDPTGAGDAFCAAFAVATGEGRDPLDAVRFACAAGACAVRVAGAEPSMPHRAQVDAMLPA